MSQIRHEYLEGFNSLKHWRHKSKPLWPCCSQIKQVGGYKTDCAIVDQLSIFLKNDFDNMFA